MKKLFDEIFKVVIYVMTVFSGLQKYPFLLNFAN